MAKSLDGKVRRFKDEADAEYWRKNISTHIIPAKEPQGLDHYFKELDRMEAAIRTNKEANKPKLSDIWNKFQQAVGDSFPDGDPFDRIGPWMNQHNLTIHDIDAAVKEYNGTDTAQEYLRQMWDDYSADAEHDAMMGAHGETYDDDQWFNRPNPWK